MKREEIEARLRKYLERDRKGVRRELLKLLLDGKKYTTAEIYQKLREKGFDLNARGVSAMVGLMSARLGILKMELGEKNRYFLKPEYVDLVKSILEEFHAEKGSL